MALLVAHTLGEGQAHLAAPDKGKAMRLGKLRAIIYGHGSVDVYLLGNGAVPQFLALLQDLSRIDTWERLFHLITKSGTCLWVDEIQNGEIERQETLTEAKSERDRSEI